MIRAFFYLVIAVCSPIFALNQSSDSDSDADDDSRVEIRSRPKKMRTWRLYTQGVILYLDTGRDPLHCVPADDYESGEENYDIDFYERYQESTEL